MMQNFLAHHPEFATQSAATDFKNHHSDMWSMMGWWGNSPMMAGFWLGQILAWITWILIIVALIVFIRWMWKKGG